MNFFLNAVIVLILLCNISIGGEKLTIFVSIVPQATFVEAIGGNMVDVQVMVQSGQSPETYQPTMKQMTMLTNAVVYFKIGVSFENVFLPKIEKTFGKDKIIDTRKGIELRVMKSHHHNEHHSHLGTDPHIWLNPRLVKIQAKTIFETLVRIDPKNKDLYKNNYNTFLKKLDTLDESLKKALLPYRGKILMVFHPAWGYFADAYGLKQESIEVEGKAPTAKQLAKIIDEAKKEGVKIIFVQPQFSTTSAKAIADNIGGKVIPINPLAKNYFENLKNIATVITKTIGNKNG